MGKLDYYKKNNKLNIRKINELPLIINCWLKNLKNNYSFYYNSYKIK